MCVVSGFVGLDGSDVFCWVVVSVGCVGLCVGVLFCVGGCVFVCVVVGSGGCCVSSLLSMLVDVCEMVFGLIGVSVVVRCVCGFCISVVSGCWLVSYCVRWDL